MDIERRRERAGHLGRHPGRGRVVVVLASLMLLAACADPTVTEPTGSRSAPIGFGPGVSGGSSVNTAGALIGSWQRFDVLTADSSSDIVTQTTTWLFDRRLKKVLRASLLKTARRLRTR